MSADDDESPARVGTRLRRRRALPGTDDGRQGEGAVTAEGTEAYEPGDFEFGYGGWTVTLDGLRMPEPERTVVPVRTTEAPPRTRPRNRAAGFEAPDGDTPAPRTGPRPVPDALARAATPTPEPADRQPRATPADRPRRPVRGGTGEDRPIIAPPARRRGGGETERTPGSPRMSRRRPMRESPARPEGARGVRKRRTQRIEGGGTVVIEDELFPLVDWSAGGIAIRSEGQLYRIGDRRKLELEIDLDDYAVNIDLEGEVVNRSSERTGWQFIAPTETQREVLRALTRASLTGEAFRAPPGTPADARFGHAPGGRRHRLAPFAALLSLPLNLVVIALAAGAAILALSDGRLPPDLAAVLAPAPAVRSEHAAVAVEGVPVETDVSGVVLEWRVAPGEMVRSGQPLVVITDAAPVDAPPEESPAAEAPDDAAAAAGTDIAGEAETAGSETAGPLRTILTSPCACTLVRQEAAPGDAVFSGETVAILAPAEAAGFIEALFAPSRAPNAGDAVAVDLPGSGERFSGIVEEVGPPAPGDDVLGLPSTAVRDGAVFARIRTSPAVPSSLAGAPAVVTLAPDA